jgi:HAD superfamily hydrolase (TIGR01509 family)
MNLIRDFSFIIFDFDGLLVDTEFFHYTAYTNMCRNRGVIMDWTFDHYCSLAHKNSSAVREEIITKCLFTKTTPWEEIYSHKQGLLKDILRSSNVQLMPGVEKILMLTKNIKRCVVTNSTREMITIIKNKLPILKEISFWITREDYDKPKPAKDAYQKAINAYGQTTDTIIVFEDTLRGLKAAEGLAKRVLICRQDHPQLLEKRDSDILYFPSFDDIE